MSKAKPITLQTRRSKSLTRERADAENAMLPIEELPLTPPRELKGRRVASATWVRLMKLYTEIEADIVSSLDFDLLVDYCIMTEHVTDLDGLRDVAIANLGALKLKAKRGKASAESVAGSIGFISEQIMGIDARVERKRMCLEKLREALYLSPKARAGYNPKRKLAPPDPEEMEAVLNEAKAVTGVR